MPNNALHWTSPRSVRLIAVLLAPLISACTTAQLYDSLQDNARDNCSKMSNTDRSACLKRIPGDYDSYRKERGKVTGAAGN